MNLKYTIKKVFRAFGFDIISFRKESSIPSVRTRGSIGAFSLDIPPGHPILKNLSDYPNYGLNLVRLAKKIEQKYHDSAIIDVGANIGDTVALLRSATVSPIIAIEGDDGYFSYLKENTEQFEHVTLAKVFLGDKESAIPAKIERVEGTLRLTPDSNAAEVPLSTLDAFAAQNQNTKSAKLLKIDTDGHDLKIISGGKNFLVDTKPAIFFEYDPSYFEALGKDGLSTFHDLSALGYESVLFYDNYGRFILSTNIENGALLSQMDAYIRERRGAFGFYDICIFHKDDADLASQCIAEEQYSNMTI